MRKNIAVIMSIFMLSSIFSVAAAEPERDGINVERMASHLGLDDTQKQAIENIQLAAQPEFEALQVKMREIQAARKALADRVRGEVEAVLTDEQRAKFAENRPGKANQSNRMFGRGDRDRRNAGARKQN